MSPGSFKETVVLMTKRMALLTHTIHSNDNTTACIFEPRAIDTPTIRSMPVTMLAKARIGAWKRAVVAVGDTTSRLVRTSMD